MTDRKSRDEKDSRAPGGVTVGVEVDMKERELESVINWRQLADRYNKTRSYKDGLAMVGAWIAIPREVRIEIKPKTEEKKP